MIYLIIGLLCIIIGFIIYFFYVNKKVIKLNKLKFETRYLQSKLQTNKNDLQHYKTQAEGYKKDIQNLQEQKRKEIQSLDNFKQNKEKQVNQIIFEYQKRSEQQIQEEANKVTKYKQNSKYALEQYSQNTEKAYEQIDKGYQIRIQELEARRASVQEELESIQATLQAAAAASLRQREKAQKIEFFKIQITDQQKSDIEKIWPLRNQLYDSSLVSKVIWTSYIQKATNQMCNRVLKDIDCGIYRITDLLTDQCYIGQSVNVGQRWKDHIKAGLGINGSNNKLYSSMLKDGVWNFSFELIEKCERNELNAKEKYWINMYNSSELGLNGNKGNG